MRKNVKDYLRHYRRGVIICYADKSLSEKYQFLKVTRDEQRRAPAYICQRVIKCSVSHPRRSTFCPHQNLEHKQYCHTSWF